MASAAPQLYYQPGGIAELIMRNCQELKLPFNPTIWAPDPHTQSAMGGEYWAPMQGAWCDMGVSQSHPRRVVLWLWPYAVGWWALRVLNTHAQLKQLLPAHPAVLRTLTARGSYTRQLVMTSDHGTLGLDWWCGSDKATWAAADAPIVLFIHGINGKSVT
jgi:hypothetical protein